MEPVRRLAALLLLSAGLFGCGDPLVDSKYRGEPILRLVGRIAALRGDGVPPDAEALVSMFWNRDLSSRPPTLVEQQSVSTNVQFPNEFEVLVFDPPTEDHALTMDSRLAVGFLLVYADLDGDRAFGAADRIVGGNANKALIWALEDVTAEEAPFAEAIPSGFSLVDFTNMACDPRRHDGPGPERVGPPVPRCSSDASCPPEFTCDTAFSVCVPRDDFELVIGPDFDLARTSCR